MAQSLSTHRVIALVTVFTSVALGSACEVEKFFPKDVGDGAARLTVRNAAVLISVLNADSKCGFASNAVNSSYTTLGDVGSPGSATWTVTDCTIDFGDKPVPAGAPSTDCNGEKTTVAGSVNVSATKTVQGILSGNPDNPVIPQSPDAVTLKLSADFTNFQVLFNDKTSDVTFESGHMEQTVSVHLAQNISLGVCGVPTTNLTLNELKVQNAKYKLNNAGDKFEVDVPLIDEKAQLGKYGKFENWVDGKIKVWDTDVDLSDDHVLDPDYKADVFEHSFECTNDLVLPVTYQCESLTPKLADGAAKLTVNTVGNLMQAVVADKNCGFAAQNVMDEAQTTGTVGEDGGEVVYTVDNCAFDFGAQTQVARDCVGKTDFASGKATVSATMRVRGRLSGDPTQPVIPTSRDPANITFHISFDNFEIKDDVSDQSMDVVIGTLDGQMAPRMAQDSTTGACSIATPVVAFTGLTWAEGSKAIVRAQGNSLGIDIDGSSLDAQNGNKDGVENKLSGSITVNGDTYGIPENGAPILDPSYTASGFLDTFSCTPNMVMPSDDAQCNFHQVIGDGAARLVVQTVGTLATLINNDSNCGFEDKLGVLIFPTATVGDVGDMGSMTWDVSDCTVGSDQLSTLSTDCDGGATFYQGTADVTSERTVTGLRTTQFLIIDAVAPASDESVTILLQDVPLHEFVTYPLAAGSTTPVGKLTIHDGTLSATVEPATGAEQSDPTIFDVPTPVARISEVHLRNAHATLEAQGKIFNIVISDTNLSAVNGSLDGISNSIAGDIIVDGDDLSESGALNPTFNLGQFDESYQCTDNLLSTVPH